MVLWSGTTFKLAVLWIFTNPLVLDNAAQDIVSLFNEIKTKIELCEKRMAMVDQLRSDPRSHLYCYLHQKQSQDYSKRLRHMDQVQQFVRSLSIAKQTLPGASV